MPPRGADGAVHLRGPATESRSASTRIAPALFALLLPLVFLHVKYQPSASIAVGGTDATLYLSDVAVLAIAAIGAWAALRSDFAPLRAGLTAYAGGAAFLALVFAATLYGPALSDDYAFAKHLFTALKLAEYAMLALATPLILRRPADLRLPLWTLTLWSSAAGLVAILQFLGLVDELDGRRPGQREPSFVGIHDLAGLSGATLCLGLLAIGLQRERRLGIAAGVAGAIGLGLSAAVAGVAGLVVAAAAAAIYARPRPLRLLAMAAVVVAVAGCVAALRSVDTDPLLEALGIRKEADVTRQHTAESWKQRVALSYIGVRIFGSHPLLGVGFEGSGEEEHYRPYVADAKRKFSGLPPIAFPSPGHEWGVQNAYVQAAADMGVLGLVAFLSVFVLPFAVAVRAARRGPPDRFGAFVAPMWLLISMGVWLGLGLVAGIPLVGLTWLAVGLAAATAAWRVAAQTGA